jgi:CheY-like chemotaxis protein
MVVDDDDDLAEIVGMLIEACGHSVRRARDGCEGLRILRERLPDVVVLDVEMPNLDGPGMAYEMLVHDAGEEHVPIVLVSGAIELERIAARVGTPYALAKPSSGDALIAAVERALRERRSPSPAPDASER